MDHGPSRELERQVSPETVALGLIGVGILAFGMAIGIAIVLATIADEIKGRRR